MNIACVLKSGPEYGPKRLYAMADTVLAHNPGANIRCLTDCDISHPGIEPVPLKHGWKGWWSKLELFRPGLFDGPTLYLDIDTVVVGSLEGLVADRFTMLPNVYRPGDFGSGCMAWTVPPVHVYEQFCKRPALYMAQYRTSNKWGDQGFIRDYLGAKPQTFGADFRSYKVHCRSRVPAGTRVVYFHGKPRPWDVTLCH